MNVHLHSSTQQLPPIRPSLPALWSRIVSSPWLPMLLLLIASLAVILPFFQVWKPDMVIDGNGYFAYLPALFSGHPFDIAPFIPEGNHGYWFCPHPKTGRFCDIFGIGTAITWLPFYTVSRLFSSGDYGTEARNGWIAVQVGSMLITLVGLVFLFLALSVVFKRWVAWTASLAALLTMPILAYCTTWLWTSHSTSFALSALLLWLVVTRKPWWSIGLTLGLMFATRPQTVFYALVPLIAYRPTWRHVLFGVASAFVAAFPQLLFWRMTFGQWVVNPQHALKPDFFVYPHVWQVLFAPNHGLFLWHPTALLATLGLIWYAIAVRKWRRLALACIAVFTVQIVVNATAYTWDAGGAFGARRFCDTLPLLALGLAFLISRHKAAIPALLILAYWNVGLLWAWSPSDNGRYAPYGNLISPVSPLTIRDVKELSGILLVQCHKT